MHGQDCAGHLSGAACPELLKTALVGVRRAHEHARYGGAGTTEHRPGCQDPVTRIVWDVGRHDHHHHGNDWTDRQRADPLLPG